MDRTLGPILKTVLFTIVVPGSVTILGPRAVLPPGSRPIIGGWGLPGIAFLMAGAAMYLSCAWEFAYRGLGTPAPIDPPKVLVARGLHKYVRNPMYLGVFCILLGEAALFRSRHLLVYAAGFVVIAHVFVVLYEEPALRKQFGSAYEDYFHAVPRWLPKLRREKTT
jgi:protein-S-isoprenylcysteine O-methyltransferase Ste14